MERSHRQAEELSLCTTSLNDFLRETKLESNSMNHVVIGNQAGDADSIVSAIAWAFVESSSSSVPAGNNSNTLLWTPVVSIPRADLQATRPETTLLLKWAGISLDDLIHIEDVVGNGSEGGLSVTLMDHNRLVAPPLLSMESSVVEIQDHHVDEGHHLESCQVRNIAFHDGAALVASTCTLVVERLQKVMQRPYPEPLSTLLLGVILIDSVNMNSAAGKVTPRDTAAVEVLLEQTAWTKPPDTNQWFEQLQQAKFDPSFWHSLSVRDTLRLDYKEYSHGQMGISSVLMKVKEFLDKPNVRRSVEQYMTERGTTYQIVMLSHESKDSGLQREIMICSKKSLEPMIEFLHNRSELQLSEYEETSLVCDGELVTRIFSQGNAKASRKVFAPILLDFFSSA